jgi:hypothetical protein
MKQNNICIVPCYLFAGHLVRQNKKNTPGALLFVGGQLEQQNKKNTRALLCVCGKYSWSQHELRELWQI